MHKDDLPQYGLPASAALCPQTGKDGWERDCALWHSAQQRSLSMKVWRATERRSLDFWLKHDGKRVDGFYDRLQTGELVAFGLPEPMPPSGGYVEIDPNRWAVLRIPNWAESTASGGGAVFHLCLFFRREDVEAWRLAGNTKEIGVQPHQTLQEIFGEVVRQTQQRLPAEAQTPVRLPDTAYEAIIAIRELDRAGIFPDGLVAQWHDECRSAQVSHVQSMEEAGLIPGAGTVDASVLRSAPFAHRLLAAAVRRLFVDRLCRGKVAGFVIQSGSHVHKPYGWWDCVEEIDFSRSRVRIGDTWYDGARFCRAADFDTWKADSAKPGPDLPEGKTIVDMVHIELAEVGYCEPTDGWKNGFDKVVAAKYRAKLQTVARLRRRVFDEWRQQAHRR